MNNVDVCAILRAQNKPYEQIDPTMKQSRFSLMIAKIENELCKPKTVKAFFDRFGYVGDWNNFERKE